MDEIEAVGADDLESEGTDLPELVADGDALLAAFDEPADLLMDVDAPELSDALDKPEALAVEEEAKPETEFAIDAVAKEAPVAEPVAAFAQPEDTVSLDDNVLAVPAAPATPDLAKGLAVARDLAAIADASAERTRTALYRAIGSAFDFSLEAMSAEATLDALLAEAGIERQDRAPMTPIVKLIFGTDYDKTRLAEYAAALSYAHRKGFAAGDLATHLNEQPGGLKAIVADERAFRRGETPTQENHELPASVAKKLRKAAAVSIENFAGEGEEFVLLFTRRNADGQLETLGALPHDPKWLKQAAKKLLG